MTMENGWSMDWAKSQAQQRSVSAVRSEVDKVDEEIDFTNEHDHDGDEEDNFHNVNIPLKWAHIDTAQQVQKAISRNGIKKVGRKITSNSVYRAMLDCFDSLRFDVSDISSESDIKPILMSAVLKASARSPEKTLGEMMGHLTNGDGRKFICKKSGEVFEPFFLSLKRLGVSRPVWVGRIHSVDTDFDFGTKELDCIVTECGSQQCEIPASCDSVQSDIGPDNEDEFDQRMTVPMTLNQRHLLERIEQLCRKNKLKKPRRLTSNVAIRVLIDMVDGIDENFSQVTTAADLMEVFGRYIVRQRKLNIEGAGNGSQNNR